MSLMDESTLIISSCQKFSDLWDVHISLLNQNWSNHPENVVLVTDATVDKSYPGIRTISAGEALEMPQRLRVAIEQIETDYIFLTLDDYFIKDCIDDQRLESVFTFMKEQNIDYFRLFSSPKAKNPIKGYKGWNWINLEDNYAVNLYPGIWKKDFFSKMLDSTLSPWQFEVTLSKRAKEEGALCAMSYNQEFPILDVVRKGKILHKANRYLKKRGLDIGDRPVISYGTEFKLFIIGNGNRILPKSIGKIVRKLLHRFGMSFFSDGTKKL